MNIRVTYVGQLKQAAGGGSENVELEGPCTPQALVTRLAQQHGAPLKDMLLDERGVPRAPLMIFLDDEQVQHDAPEALPDGARVTLLSPIAGG